MAEPFKTADHNLLPFELFHAIHKLVMKRANYLLIVII